MFSFLLCKFAFRISTHHDFCLLLLHLVLSCLIFSFVVSSLRLLSLLTPSQSFSVSFLRVMWCVVVCVCVVCVWCVWCVCVWCVCVYVCMLLLCVWLCVCVVCVWCWLCDTLKKPPCVDSKSPRVYGHHAHMCFNMCAWCRHTRGRFESRHGENFERTHGPSPNTHTHAKKGVKTKENKKKSPSVLLTKICPRRVITCFRGSPKVTTGCCPCSSLRIDRERHVPDSSNHSLYLTKLSSSSYPGETLEGTSREMVRFVFRSHEKSKTNDLHVRIATPPCSLLTLPFSRCVHHLSSPNTFVSLEPLSRSRNLHTLTLTHTLTHTRIHKHAGQHTKTETGDTEELNSEGNEKRRRRRESRVNSGVEKKVPVTNIDTKKRCTCLAWLTNRDSKIAKTKLIVFGY